MRGVMGIAGNVGQNHRVFIHVFCPSTSGRHIASTRIYRASLS